MPRATQAGDETASSCDDSYDDSVEDCEQPWISWFCGLKGNEMFCEIEEDYIQDDFNLSGLSSSVPYYDYALDIILDVDRGQSVLSEQQQELVESAAEMLYGLIHARYILTQRGMTAMLEKYKQHHFGRCPRFLCGNTACLPVGTSDVFRTSTVKIFCPNCKVSELVLSQANADERGIFLLIGRISTSQGVNTKAIPTEHILERRFRTFF